jgi:hypothetical protein
MTDAFPASFAFGYDRIISLGRRCAAFGGLPRKARLAEPAFAP